MFIQKFYTFHALFILFTANLELFVHFRYGQQFSKSSKTSN